MAYTRKRNLALVVGNESSLHNMSDIRELVKELGEKEQEVVLSETTEFFRARAQGALSYLAMGEHAVKVRDVLEPRRMFKAWAKSIPNMTISNVYRNIWAWENAQRTLTKATVSVAAREGFRLISTVKGGTFSEPYMKAVKKVEKDIGPAPEDEVEAGKWLRAVQDAKRKMSKAGRPKDARKYSLTGRVKRVVSMAARIAAGLPEEKQREFLNRIIEGVDALGKKKAASVAA